MVALLVVREGVYRKYYLSIKRFVQQALLNLF